MKKQIPIDDLLVWAYRDELPKKELSTSNWDGVAGYGMLGGIDIDDDPWQAYLRSQRYPFIGKPHEDALLLDWMVRGLPDVAVDWPRERAGLLGHLLSYLDDDEIAVSAMSTGPVVTVEEGRDRRGKRTASAKVERSPPQPHLSSVSQLVRMHAVMGTRPVWDMPIRLIPTKGPNGKPVIAYEGQGQLDGRLLRGLTKGRRYGPKARCLLDLDPTAAEIAAARWEYQVWHQALMTLANESWNLRDHVPLPPRAQPHPWLTGQTQDPPIRHSPRTNAKPIPLHPQRDRAGSPSTKPRPGPVRHIPIPPSKERA